MIRDIRDPREIGAALDARRAHSPSTPICAIADQVLNDPTIRNYDEKNPAYADRVTHSREMSKNGDGQLAMFRAA